MRTTLYIIVLFFSFLSYSCFQHAGNEDVEQPNSYFSETSYSKIILLQLDSMFYHCYNIDSLQEYAGMKVVDDGLGFIDSAGNMLSEKIIRRELSTTSVAKLKKIFRVSQEKETHAPNTCIPIYRNVLLFLDAQDKYVAHMNIYFGCGSVVFHPYTKAMDQLEHSTQFFQLKNLLAENGVDTLVDGPPADPMN